MTTKPARPPKGLAAAGLELWRAIAKQVCADGLQLDARETALLTEACREADVRARIDEALIGVPVLMEGAQGQMVANPLIGEARRSRTTIAALLKQIGLEDPMASTKPGSGGRTTSWQARSAANSRHSGGA